MAASDNVHPNQLQMFMRPGEILAKTQGRSVDYGDYPGRTEAMLKTDVLSQSMRNFDGGDSTYESVKDEGVKRPIILTPGGDRDEALARTPSRSEHFWQGNGHHRVASAMEAERATGKPQYIPVVHDHDFMGSRDTRETFGVAED